jgi:hypothetical protein
MTGSGEEFEERGKGVATCEDEGIYIKLVNWDSRGRESPKIDNGYNVANYNASFVQMKNE